MTDQVRRRGEEIQTVGSVKGDGKPGSGTIKRFRDWRAAAEYSISRKAISEDYVTVHVPPYHHHLAMTLKAKLCIEIEGGRMSWRFHSSPGIPVEALPQPHREDIDRVSWWRSW